MWKLHENLLAKVRWAARTAAGCPRCDWLTVYTYATRKLFKCRAVALNSRVTSGTIFASRKLGRDLLALSRFSTNGAKGHTAFN